MKKKFPALSRSYLSALGNYLSKGPDSSLQMARRLGVRAVQLGVETPDMASIHEEALVCLLIKGGDGTKATMASQGAVFFAEAVMPIQGNCRGTQKENIQLTGLVRRLTFRTSQLADSNKKLKEEIAQRKVVEASLRSSEKTSSQLLERSRHMQDDLRELSRRLLTAQEEERKRISRELHDVIAQTLAAINVRLAGLKIQTTANSKDIHKKITTALRLVQKSVDIVHGFARDLRPTVLDDLGLIPALGAHLKTYRSRTSIRVDLLAAPEVEKLDSARRTVLYRIAQESLANVAQHASASHVRMVLTYHGSFISMEIQDNGKGFKVDDEVFAPGRKRLGLLGMRERAEMVGGTFCVESAPGKKTTVRVEIPLRQGRAKKRSGTKPSAATLKCI